MPTPPGDGMNAPWNDPLDADAIRAVDDREDAEARQEREDEWLSLFLREEYA